MGRKPKIRIETEQAKDMDERLRAFYIQIKEGALQRIHPMYSDLSLYPELKERFYQDCKGYYQFYLPHHFVSGHFLLINGSFCMHPEKVYHTENQEDLTKFQEAIDEGLIDIVKETNIPAWLAEHVRQSGRLHLDLISQRAGISRKLHLLQNIGGERE